MKEENQFTLPGLLQYYGSITEIQNLLRQAMNNYIAGQIYSNELGHHIAADYYLLYSLHEFLGTIPKIES